MNVSLPDDLIEFVRAETHGGGYGNKSDVVRDALRLLREQRSERAALQRLVGEGIDELAEGKDTPLTRKELRAMADAAKKRHEPRKDLSA